MIIGTTNELPTIMLVTAIGVGIAVILHFIKEKKYKYLFGGIITLAFCFLICYRLFVSIKETGISAGIIGGILMALLIFVLAVRLFLNMKNDK